MAELSVDIDVNTQAAVANVRKLGESFTDTERDMLQLVDAGQKIGKTNDDIARDLSKIDGRPFDETRKDVDKLDKALRDLDKAGIDASRDLGRSFDKVADDADEAGDKVRRGLGDGAKKGFGNAADASAEFKNEALQNLSEVASSYDGSLQSLGDLVQGTLGGVASSLPVIGLAAAGAAAGVGMVVEAFVKAGEATDEARESAYEYGLTVAGAGAYADAAARINELTGSVEGLKRVQDIATASGWEQQDVVKALATGDGLPALSKAFDEGANSTAIATNRMLELQGTLDGAAQGFNLAGEAATLQGRALYDLAMSAGTATGEVDDLGNEVRNMPDGKQVVIDAETQTAHSDIDAIEKRQLAEKTVRMRVIVDKSEWDNWTPRQKQGFVKANRLDQAV